MSEISTPATMLSPVARVAEQERATILAALRQTGGDVARAAREIGMPRMTLIRRIKQHELGDAVAKIRAGAEEHAPGAKAKPAV